MGTEKTATLSRVKVPKGVKIKKVAYCEAINVDRQRYFYALSDKGEVLSSSSLGLFRRIKTEAQDNIIGLIATQSMAAAFGDKGSLEFLRSWRTDRQVAIRLYNQAFNKLLAQNEDLSVIDMAICGTHIMVALSDNRMLIIDLMESSETHHPLNVLLGQNTTYYAEKITPFAYVVTITPQVITSKADINLLEVAISYNRNFLATFELNGVPCILEFLKGGNIHLNEEKILLGNKSGDARLVGLRSHQLTSPAEKDAASSVFINYTDPKPLVTSLYHGMLSVVDNDKGNLNIYVPVKQKYGNYQYEKEVAVPLPGRGVDVETIIFPWGECKALVAMEDGDMLLIETGDCE